MLSKDPDEDEVLVKRKGSLPEVEEEFLSWDSDKVFLDPLGPASSIAKAPAPALPSLQLQKTTFADAQPADDSPANNKSMSARKVELKSPRKSTEQKPRFSSFVVVPHSKHHGLLLAFLLVFGASQ